MATLTGIVRQLKKERDRVEQQLSGLNAAITAFARVYGGRAKPTRKRHAQANDVSIDSSQDCSGATGEVGEGQARESSLTYTRPSVF